MHGLHGAKPEAMPFSWSQRAHPSLTAQTCAITSAKANRYNCIAWAAGDVLNNWWPSRLPVGYWPPGVPRVRSLAAFIQAFGTLGYELCDDGTLQLGLEKIAIYGLENPADGTVIPTHAALQLESGEWTSKMGPLEDIKHNTVHDVNGPVYGEPRQYMSKPRRQL
jgi:hypothetical protein